MRPLTDQVRQGAEHAWASLSEGWQGLRARANSALTRFRRGEQSSATGPDSGRFESGGWGLLAADVRLEDERIVVRIEAPGMNREDLQIDIDSDRLCVRGEKRFDSESRGADYHLVQCAYGSFRREVLLPQPVDAARASASYRDGVLRIEMPRREPGRGRRIQVS
jgi:HSP20 family protein